MAAVRSDVTCIRTASGSTSFPGFFLSLSPEVRENPGNKVVGRYHSFHPLFCSNSSMPVILQGPGQTGNSWHLNNIKHCLVNNVEVSGQTVKTSLI